MRRTWIHWADETEICGMEAASVSAPAEGIIRVTLSAQTGQGFARIENTRPLSLASRFAGRQPADVASRVPLVFSVCRAAQSAACAQAIENATGAAPSPRVEAIRALAVLGETAREHAVQVLHSWPRCVHMPDPAMSPPSIRRLLATDRKLSKALKDADAVDFASLGQAIFELNAILAEAVFGETLEEWLARRSAGELGFWARRNETLAQTVFEYLVQAGIADAGAAAVSPLPEVNPEDMLSALFGSDSESFIAEPDWGGIPRETAPLGRQANHPLVKSVREHYGPGILARLAACLSELAEIPGKMRALARTLEDASAEGRPPVRTGGVGLGSVEAARGRLIHAVEIAAGSVWRYRILAPTEWNFHPRGAAAKGLASIALASPARREALARLFITAVDPCVGYELSFTDA
jgi:uptake hydrogenase large subunit